MMNILSLNDRAIQNRDIAGKGGKRVREDLEQNSQQTSWRTDDVWHHLLPN